MKKLILIVLVLSSISHTYAMKGGSGKVKREAARVEACSGKSLDDVCAFSDRDKEIQGKCKESRRSGELMCKGPKRNKKSRS